MIERNITMTKTIDYQWETQNKSFIDMHIYLKNKGIKNNKFFLMLFDSALKYVDPHDPRLSREMKQRVLAECIKNYWYFIREVVRIPQEGAAIGQGVRYKLHRGNLAMNYGFILNWDMFVELPRQNYKTVSAGTRYLWVFGFGTTNTDMMFIHKKHDGAKDNLKTVKELRAELPSYLQMDKIIDHQGNKLKGKDNVESLEHPLNKNNIKTMASARNKSSAMNLGRGCTQAIQWYDEYAFIIYNDIIYKAATPAYSQAAINAEMHGAPHGILITTTPGITTTDEGAAADYDRNIATKFDELMYDMAVPAIKAFLAKNKYSTFVYIRYTYKQLGRSEVWFAEQVRRMKQDYEAIRREILLEWARNTGNCPFTSDELKAIQRYTKDPINTWSIGGFPLNLYTPLDLRYPPIIGVDVSTGVYKDGSAITIIDSRTTQIIADFNCNYISPEDLAKVIYEIVVKYMPNAVVNIERNNVGIVVLSLLAKTKIKKNLYWEIKDTVLEDRIGYGGKHNKIKTKVKKYGFTTDKITREILMDIMRERVMHHKDLITSKALFSELETLEVKKSGKIEAVSGSHDDQVMSWLLALYVWREGQGLMENFGIRKVSIPGEKESASEILSLEEQYTDVSKELDFLNIEDESILETISYLKSKKSISRKDYETTRFEQEEEVFNNMLRNNPIMKDAYTKKYNLDPNALNMQNGNMVDMSQYINNMIFDPEDLLLKSDGVLYKQMMAEQMIRERDDLSELM